MTAIINKKKSTYSMKIRMFLTMMSKFILNETSAIRTQKMAGIKNMINIVKYRLSAKPIKERRSISQQQYQAMKKRAKNCAPIASELNARTSVREGVGETSIRPAKKMWTQGRFAE